MKDLIEEAPQELKSNIVAFNKDDFAGQKNSVPEPVVDPGLEKASIEELNAALEAAFRDMEEGR